MRSSRRLAAALESPPVTPRVQPADTTQISYASQTPVRSRPPVVQAALWTAAGAAFAVVATFTYLGTGLSTSASRTPAATPSAYVARYDYEVLLQDARRGCRWDSGASKDGLQVAECGSERETVRIVFDSSGRVTEYRLNAKQDPSRATATATGPLIPTARPPTPRP